MLISINQFKDFSIKAVDHNMGSPEGLYFDDTTWMIRYILLNTGNWLIERKVLLSPHSIENFDIKKHIINFKLTEDQIENGPSVEENRPVSRQHEIELSDYYNWPPYWLSPDAGFMMPPVVQPPVLAGNFKEKKKHLKNEGWEPHLRSSREVTGYTIHAKDDSIGHIEDFLFDINTWYLKYIVIDTRNIFPGGKKVLVDILKTKYFKWSFSEAKLNVNKDYILNLPEFNPEDLNKPGN